MCTAPVSRCDTMRVRIEKRRQTFLVPLAARLEKAAGHQINLPPQLAIQRLEEQPSPGDLWANGSPLQVCLVSSVSLGECLSELA